MLTELCTYDEEVTQLERRLREIPADIESQRLLVALTEIHTRVTSLINEAKQGQIALEQAQEGREKRGQEIHTYKLFLEETETWLKNIVSKIDEQHSFNTNKVCWIMLFIGIIIIIIVLVKHIFNVLTFNVND